MIPRAAIWLAAVAGLAGVLAVLYGNGQLHIQNDLLALLPQPQRDPVKTAAMQSVAKLGERRLVLLIGAVSDTQRRAAAAAAAQVLRDSHAFSDVVTGSSDWSNPAQQRALEHMYFQHRFHLLAPADRSLLQQLEKHPPGAGSSISRQFITRAQTQLYGLGISGSRFLEDPFGLSRAYQNAFATRLAAPGVRIAPDGSLYVENDQHERYAVIFAQTRQDPFEMSAQTGQSRDLSAALQAARGAAPGAEIRVSGVLRHAAAATRQAKREVSLIGSGSLAGIVLLMLWTFSGLRPLLLSLAVVAGGCLFALTVTLCLFGSIHVLTLVFGASLVGVAVDYCLHFFCQRWSHAAPAAALRHILPAISLGLVTSVLAYGGMALAPFPGLRQMAVFAAFGLIGAWLGVLLLLPALAGPAARTSRPLHLAHMWLTHGPVRLAARHETWVLAGLVAAFVLCAGLSMLWLTPDDDIHQLYTAAPELLHDEQQVAALLGAHSSGHVIAVHGDSPAQVLQTEANVVRALRRPEKPVAQVTAITQAFPPVATQRDNYRLVAATLYQAQGPLDQLLSAANVGHDRIASQHADFAAARGQTLPFQDWISSAAGAPFKPLWLATVGGQWESLILVHKVNNPQRYSAILANYDQALNINRVAEVSALLARYRSLASWFLGGAYCLAGLLLCGVLGARGALIVLLPPLLASAATALLFAVTGWPFSLFNLMAMILLLGMGADYGIFLRMAKQDAAPALTAVALSAATTLLAFGLLAASHTPALHSFGLTLAVGLGLTFTFAALIGGGAKPTTA